MRRHHSAREWQARRERGTTPWRRSTASETKLSHDTRGDGHLAHLSQRCVRHAKRCRHRGRHDHPRNWGACDPAVHRTPRCNSSPSRPARPEMLLARRVSPCRVSTVCMTRDVAQSVNQNAANHALSTGTSKSGGSARLVLARRAPQAFSSRLILGAVETPFRGGCARSTHEPRECLAAAPAFVANTKRSACGRTGATAAAPEAQQPPWEWHVGLRGGRRNEAVAPVSGGAAAAAGAPTTARAAGQRPLSLPLLPMPP